MNWTRRQWLIINQTKDLDFLWGEVDPPDRDGDVGAFHLSEPKTEVNSV